MPAAALAPKLTGRKEKPMVVFWSTVSTIFVIAVLLVAVFATYCTFGGGHTHQH